MSAKSSTIDVAVDQPEGPNAVADAIVYPEGVAFATDVNAAVHSVGEKARAEVSSATDAGAIIHSEGNSTATDVDSAVHSAGAQDIYTTEADASVHSLYLSQSQLGHPEQFIQNKANPLQNFILPFFEANQVTASTKQSSGIVPIREKSIPHSKNRTLRKGTASCKISRTFVPLLRHSMTKVLVILCMINAFTASLPARRSSLNPVPNAPKCLISESDLDKGPDSVEMSLDLPLPSNDSESKGGTSHASPHSCSKQGEENGDNVRAPTSKLPSVKTSWRQVKNDLQMTGTSSNLSPQGTGPPEPDPPDENLHQRDCRTNPTSTTAPPLDVRVPSDVEIAKQMQRAPLYAPHPETAEPSTDGASLSIEARWCTSS